MFLRIFLMLFYLFCATAAQANPPLNVIVTLSPQKMLVERIGQQAVKVTVLAANQDPHHFEPTPSQVAAASQAQLLFRVGYGFEGAFIQRLQAKNRALIVVDARQGISLRRNEEGLTLGGHAHDEHEDEVHDLHLWTDPQLLKRMAAQVRDVLSQQRPAQAKQFASNYETLAQTLDQLDQELQAKLKPLAGKSFLVFHPTWGYFADRYHLKQVAIEFDGKEPTVKQLQQILHYAQQAHVKVIFVQPQFSQRSARTLAQRLNAEVVTLDPLAEDVVATLRQAGAIFVKALP